MKPTSLRTKDKQVLNLDQIKESMDKLQKRKAMHNKVLALIEKVKGGINTPLWDHVREKCNELINGAEALEDRADEYRPEAHPIPERILWKASGFRKAAKTILAVETMITNEAGYRDALVKIEKELKDLGERKSQLGG
jgi:uncharacterized coiled-coil DUF342 family protein